MSNKSKQSVVERNREVLSKAFTVGSEPSGIPLQSSQQQPEDRESVFNKSGAIEPPHDPETLAGLFEISNSLRPNVDAYAVNIDAFGHRLEAAIDLDAEDANEKIADSIIMERLAKEGFDITEAELDDLKPTDEEIENRAKALKLGSRIEKSKVQAFFRFVAQDMSFPKLRKITRQDLEVTGNAYWEILRNNAGSIARFVYVPSWTVRLRGINPQPMTVKERVQISPITFGTVNITKQFRTYVQLAETGTPVFFKEFGDPRIVSRTTGHFFSNMEELRKKEGETAQPANEMIHFKIESSRSPYGVPRWIGVLISVLGSRSAEEVNFFYFENKTVPPMAVLVSGGRLSKSSVPRIENFIENQIKGKRNFHKIMVLEAVAPNNRTEGPSPQRPMIEIKPLLDAQHKDGLFQEYDQNNIDKVGSSFRVPRLLRGESRDFNRATALAALRMAEEQVFQPERDDFDFFVNNRIMPELNAKFWRYQSNSPVSRDPETMGKLVAELTKQGVLVPAESRMLAGDIFNREFEIIKDDWTKQPLSFTLAGIQTGQESSPSARRIDEEKGDTTSGDLDSGGRLKPAQGKQPKIPSITSDGMSEVAQMLLRIRSSLTSSLQKEEIEQLRRDREENGGETIVIEVTPDQMDEFIDRE